MKVAICFYGSIGRMESYRHGQLKAKWIDIEIPYRHYKKYIFDKNKNCDIDIFCHSSSKGFHAKLAELYQPKKLCVENNPFDEQVDSTKIRNYANQSRWYSTYKVNQMREEYEIEQQKWWKIKKFKYDLVFLTRYDVVFFEGIRFDELDPNIFYIQGTKYDDVGRNWAKVGRTLDWWFISSPENMSKFCNAYTKFDKLTKETKKLGLPSYDQHCIAYQQIKNYNFETEELLYREDDNVLCRFIQRKFHERHRQNAWELDTSTGLYKRKIL